MIPLLIVHQDAEFGEELARMVKEYTGHESARCRTESEALVLLRRRPNIRPRILLAELDGVGLDGFNLAAQLSENYPGLQTLFCPSYPATAQRMEIAHSKVFPEPVDGERLIETIERSVRMLPGAPDLFPVLDLLQLCCLARRSGALQMVTGGQAGMIYLREGRLMHAQVGNLHGMEALVELTSWAEVEFAYDRVVAAPATSLKGEWDALLIEALAERQRRALPEWRR